MNWLTIVYIGVIFVAFYFLLIRPQQKRTKDQQALLSALRNGQRVVTIGGMYGTIERVSDDVIELRISDGVVVDVAKSAIARHVDTAGHLLDDEQEHEIEAEVGAGAIAKEAAGDAPAEPAKTGADADATDKGDSDADALGKTGDTPAEAKADDATKDE